MEHATNPDNVPSLQAIIEEFLEHRREVCTPRTIRSHEWALKHLAERCPNLPVSREDVAAVVERPELATKTQRLMLTSIRSFLNWAERQHGVSNLFRPPA